MYNNSNDQNGRRPRFTRDGQNRREGARPRFHRSDEQFRQSADGASVRTYSADANTSAGRYTRVERTGGNRGNYQHSGNYQRSEGYQDGYQRSENRQQRFNGGYQQRSEGYQHSESGRQQRSDNRYQRSERSFNRAPRRDNTRNANSVYSQRKQHEYRQQHEDLSKPMRLNKFLANAGVCSRREADDFIQAGVISVNGEIVTTLGARVMPTDIVKFHDQPVRREKKVYILLNKPKNTVTTTDDPEERHTVLDIVRNACAERIYPVGRLDRNTTGVLLLTNDGDLAARLTHPKFNKRKIYAATLDRDLTDEDRDTIMAGIELDDELVVPDALEFTKEADRRHIGLTIHSGQNRVVRRIFEKVGYKVLQLDRVSFAGLTKKNVGRGKFRFLSPKEVAYLQMGAFE